MSVCGRNGTYFPWASGMEACDSAGTWPCHSQAQGWRYGEQGPRWWPLQTSTATLDTHQATFWDPDSPPDKAVGQKHQRLPPSWQGCAEGEGEREGRVGRVKGMGARNQDEEGGEGKGEGRKGDGEEEKWEKRGSWWGKRWRE